MPEPTPMGLAYRDKKSRSDNGKPSDAQKEMKLPKIWTGSELVQAEFPDPRWAVPGIVPEGLTWLAGAPKIGKSFFVLGMGWAISRGGRAFGAIPVEQGEVLYLALEDGPKRVKNRLVAMGYDIRDQDPFHIVTTWKKMGDGGLKMLAHWLDQHPDCRLVIVDTLAKIRPADLKPTNLYQADYDVGDALHDIACHYRIALVVTNHNRKMKADDWLEQMSGTFGLAGAADGAMAMFRDRGKKEALLCITGRDIEDETKLAIRWDEKVVNWCLTGDYEQVRMSQSRKSVIKLLGDTDQAMHYREIAVMLRKLDPEATEAGVKQLVWRMSQDGQVRNVGDGRYLSVSGAGVSPEVMPSMSSVTPEQAGNAVTDAVSSVTESPIDLRYRCYSVTEQGNTCNAGNAVTPVTAVTADTCYAENGRMDCLGCGQAMPEGWYFRCPDCLDKQEGRIGGEKP